MGNFLNNVWGGIKKVGLALGPVLGVTPVGQAINTANALSSTFNNSSTSSQAQQSTAPTPTSQIGKINVASYTPTVAPITSPTTQTSTPTPFKIDTSNITSDHLGGNATYGSVIDTATQNNPYAGLVSQYQQNVAPYNIANATQFSPDYLNAYNQTLNTNQGFRAGVQNIRGRPEALDFQQGQEAALTRDTALTQQANAENMTLQEAIRKNNIDIATAGRGQAQEQFQNAFNTTQAGLNYGIQAGQLGISQQSANQGRYEYQQITDPTTGFPTIQILDKQSGLPVGNVSPGSFAGQNIINSGMLNNGNSGTSGDVVAGYNLSGYATDPTHNQQVSNLYQSITQATQSVGGVTNAATAQAVIDQLAPNSPITGQAIMTTAQKYGIDPAMMISLIQQESMLGASNIAQKDNNFGGLTWSPGSDKIYQGASIGSPRPANEGGNYIKFNTPENGINAMGQILASRKVAGQQNSVVGQARDNSEILRNTKQQFPVAMQNGVMVTANGIPYVNIDQIKGPAQQAAATFAATKGIKAFSDNDAKGLQAMDTINQSLNQMMVLSNQVLNPSYGGLGTLANVIKNTYGQVTGTNPKISDFNIYKDSAIKAVTALAGGAGSGLRLNTSTIEAAVNNLPTKGDSLETAIEKINKTRDLLNIQLGTAFSNPAIGNGIVQYDGHSYNSGDIVYSKGKLGVVNPDGTITVQ